MRMLFAALVVLAMAACGGGSANGRSGNTEVLTPPPAAAPIPVMGTTAVSNQPPTTPVIPSSSQVPPATSATPSIVAEQQAMYRVTLATTWTAAAFPTQFPAGRHFSGLVGAVHDAAVTFWTPGTLASVGIERMAELGNKSTLLDEIGAAAAGHVGSMLSGDGISANASEVTLYFTVSQQHPLVTLVSMVAPSPDWFVGVHGLALFEQGAWLERVVVPLPVWDAGTDDGATFTSPDIEPAQHGPIRLLTSSAGNTDFANGVHRSSGASVATLTFERVR